MELLVLLVLINYDRSVRKLVHWMLIMGWKVLKMLDGEHPSAWPSRSAETEVTTGTSTRCVSPYDDNITWSCQFQLNMTEICTLVVSSSTGGHFFVF